MLKIITIVLSGLSTLMLGFTLLCGFWIRSHTAPGMPADPSSLTFHMQIAVATAILVVITLGFAVFGR